MIFLACTCGTVLRVTGDPEEGVQLLGAQSEWYPDKYPCPREGCSKKMLFTEAIESSSLGALTVYDTTLVEAFSAMHGAGLPEERDCGADAVKTLLLGQRVTGVDVRQIRGSNRSVVHSLLFADGRRLYLGSSPEGAVAYRIAQRAVA